MADVIVIGAGIAGSAVARELSRYDLDIEVVEAGYDVACGASRSNSGIVHGGYDPVPGTKKALYNIRGMRLIPKLADELGFRYVNNGSLVIALTEDDLPAVRELVRRGAANGVEVREIGAEELHEIEPAVNPSAVGALLCEESGICDPFGMTVAFAENAATNGVKFRFESRVSAVRRSGDGWEVELEGGETLSADVVVNAAGVHAIDLHNQVSAHTLESRPRLGEYVLLSRDMHDVFTHTMFRAPGPKGKGVLVAPTADGNLIVGPDAVDETDADDTATTPEGLAWVIEQAKLTWPAYNGREVIVNFAGVRPTGADGDFVIGQPDDAPGFFDIAAFDSPGLTSAAAVAVDVASDVAELLGGGANESFDGHRDTPPRFLDMTDEERAAAIAGNPLFAHMICRCEHVTEAEVVAAIHGPLPAVTINAVKRRCRAGMGRCQGGFCEPLVTEIICRETGLAIQDVRRGEPGSEVAPIRRGEERS